MWGIVLMVWIDVEGASLLWVAPFPGQVVLGCVRKLSEHGHESEPVSNEQLAMLYGFCLKLLPEILPRLPH